MICILLPVRDTRRFPFGFTTAFPFGIHYSISVWIHYITSSYSHDSFSRRITLGAAAGDIIAIGNDVVPGEKRRQVEAVVKRLNEKYMFFSKSGDAKMTPAVALQLLQNLLSASSYCGKTVWMLGEAAD
jgi:hypothetical protein